MRRFWKGFIMGKTKWIALGTLLTSGALLFQSGCLSAFWHGLAYGPTDNRWLNIAVDLANKIVFG